VVVAAQSGTADRAYQPISRLPALFGDQQTRCLWLVGTSLPWCFGRLQHRHTRKRCLIDVGLTYELPLLQVWLLSRPVGLS
jgi:hypothetical protein